MDSQMAVTPATVRTRRSRISETMSSSSSLRSDSARSRLLEADRAILHGLFGWSARYPKCNSESRRTLLGGVAMGLDRFTGKHRASRGDRIPGARTCGFLGGDRSGGG
jgi:hypothetical protein